MDIKDNMENKHSYPRHDIDPKRKDKNWILNYGKAFYHDFLNRNGKVFYTNSGRYNENLRYSLGQQDIQQYKAMVGCDDTQRSSINTNWDIVPIMPKFVDITVGNMQKREFNIECNAIDPTAQDAVKETRAKLEANVYLKETLDRITEITGVDFDGGERQELPQTLEEIELHMQLNDKLEVAINMEDGLDLVYYLNDWKQISEQLDRDLVVYGAAACKDYTDNNGMPRVRRVDPRNLLTQFSKTPHFKGCEAFGEIVTMTMAEFQRRVKHEFSPTEKEEIYQLFSNKNNNHSNYHNDSSSYGNSSYSSSYNGNDYRFGSPYDDVVITCFDFEFSSTNTKVYEKKENKHGNSSTYKKTFNYKSPKNSKFKREAMKRQYGVWYKGLWIVNTNYIFEAGLCRDMKVPKSSFEEALSNYHVVAPGMTNMNNISTVERMIPVCDDIQLNIIKLRQAIARARPKGLLIEIGALENIPKGKGGGTFKPLEIISMYNENGNMLYRKFDDQGNPIGPPMQELENGMARDVMNYISIINFYLGLLRDTTGINEVADASTPDPDLLKGVAELAVQSTNNALHGLYAGRKYLFESLSRSLSIRIQDTVESGELKGYAKALGESDYRLIKVNKKVSLHEFGIKIEDRPDPQERAILEQHLNTALQQRNQSGAGGITIDVYYAVKAFQNLKHAQQYLAFMVKKIKREDEAKVAHASQLNSQQQQESALVASQAKQQEIQLETNEKIRFEQEKAKITEAIEASKHARKLEEIKLQGQIKGLQIDQTDLNKANLSEFERGNQNRA